MEPILPMTREDQIELMIDEIVQDRLSKELPDTHMSTSDLESKIRRKIKKELLLKTGKIFDL